MNTFIKILLLSLAVNYCSQLSFGSETEISNTYNLKEIQLSEDEFKEAADIEVELQNETFVRGSDIDSLIRAKFKLISGDLKLAKTYLNRINRKSSKLLIIKERYLSIIAFIEGHFEESLDHLKNKLFDDFSTYPQICLLKIINYMAINDIESLKREHKSCLSYSLKTSNNEAYWLEVMINLKLKDTKAPQINFKTSDRENLSDIEMSKLWLKSGLYLNKEKELLNLLASLPEGTYESKRVREIIAFLYLRSDDPKDKQKALSFVDDIESANAENIKGNLNLQKKEYELAFGHFRLALQKKQDSSNSLDRAIPLSWILNQWSDGLGMLNNNNNKTLDPRNKKAIKIAFLIREKKFPEAEKELNLLKLEFKNSPPLEVSIMDSYVSLILSEKDNKYDIRKLEETNESSCRSFDGMSCWISLQFIQWKNLGKTIKRDEEIYYDKDMSIDSLKEKKEIIPLKEIITVDQKDIEELDGAGIKIMKAIEN